MAESATQMEATQCGADVDEATLEPILDGTLVDAVEPLHPGWSNLDPEITGAMIKVRAMQGVTSEWLARALECYSARRALGHVQTASNDPFFLPDRVVRIEVRSDRDAFLVGVEATTPADARVVLARANAWIAGRTNLTSAHIH